MLSWLVRFFTGSRTIAAAVQLVTLVARGIDKGFKDKYEDMADFVWDKLKDDYRHPDGPIKKQELQKVIEHAIGLVDGVWKILHKD